MRAKTKTQKHTQQQIHVVAGKKWPYVNHQFQILMYENSHVTIYGYIEAWTYHPMLNISVIPQRRYNLAPSVYRKLYDSEGGKVASVTSGLCMNIDSRVITYLGNLVVLWIMIYART